MASTETVSIVSKKLLTDIEQKQEEERQRIKMLIRAMRTPKEERTKHDLSMIEEHISQNEYFIRFKGT